MICLMTSKIHQRFRTSPFHPPPIGGRQTRDREFSRERALYPWPRRRLKHMQMRSRWICKWVRAVIQLSSCVIFKWVRALYANKVMRFLQISLCAICKLRHTTYANEHEETTIWIICGWSSPRIFELRPWWQTTRTLDRVAIGESGLSLSGRVDSRGLGAGL